MAKRAARECPDCVDMDRRDFVSYLGRGAVAFSALSPLAALAAEGEKAASAPKVIAKPEKPAEALIRELYASFSSEQKQTLVYPWDHGASATERPTRTKMVNGPHFDKKIGASYTKPQQELCQQILRAICSDDDGYQRITRRGTFDASGSFEAIGALLFGEPVDGKPYSFVFSGHHLTVRCDGNSEPGAAFGGPMYYGHSPNGYNAANVFNYQTRSVLNLFGALDGEQRKQAIVTGKGPGEQYGSVRLDPAQKTHPGIALAALSGDQKELVEKVMRDILSPYRKEDGDEVMEIVKANGGLDQVHLAFYQESDKADQKNWNFWRLEGPGFVWNYRVLPHVHTFVNIAKQA